MSLIGMVKVQRARCYFEHKGSKIMQSKISTCEEKEGQSKGS